MAAEEAEGAAVSETDFFQQLVQKGKQLKPVDLERVNRRLTADSGTRDALASALADALAKMRPSIATPDDHNDENDDDDDDDDW